MTKFRELHENWLSDPAYRAEYDALEGEFAAERERLSREGAAVTFVVYRSLDGAFRWRLRDAGGRLLAESVAPAADRAEVDRQINVLRASVGEAHVVDEAA